MTSPWVSICACPATGAPPPHHHASSFHPLLLSSRSLKLLTQLQATLLLVFTCCLSRLSRPPCFLRLCITQHSYSLVVLGNQRSYTLVAVVMVRPTTTTTTGTCFVHYIWGALELTNTTFKWLCASSMCLVN